MDHTDLELSIDQKATAIKAVEQAKQIGATACIDYTAPDHRYYHDDGELYMESRILPEIRETIKAECEKQGMDYVEQLGPDFVHYIPMPGTSLIQWPSDTIFDKIDAYGKDICFFSSQCRTQNGLVWCGLDPTIKGIVVQLCHPGLFHKYTEFKREYSAVSIIDNENQFGDLEWIIKQMKSKLEERKAFGRFATWRVPFTMAATTAAVEYAIGYCEGEIESKTDLNAMRSCFEKAMEIYNAKDIGFELDIDPEHDNNFMFTEDYIVLSTKE
jgi:hypothetical protein